jgi:hypothetical protein
MRKLKVVYNEKKQLLEKVAELERLQAEAEAEEKQKIEDATASIEMIASGIEMFCGVILSQQDIVAVVDLALKTGEPVKIPFKLYFKE